MLFFLLLLFPFLWHIFVLQITLITIFVKHVRYSACKRKFRKVIAKKLQPHWPIPTKRHHDVKCPKTESLKNTQTSACHKVYIHIYMYIACLEVIFLCHYLSISMLLFLILFLQFSAPCSFYRLWTVTCFYALCYHVPRLLLNCVCFENYLPDLCRHD